MRDGHSFDLIDSAENNKTEVTGEKKKPISLLRRTTDDENEDEDDEWQA
jgi:hypothetical protein